MDLEIATHMDEMSGVFRMIERDLNQHQYFLKSNETN